MDKTIIKALEEHHGFKYTTILPKNIMYEERQMWWFSFNNGYDVAVIQFEYTEDDGVFCLALLKDGVIYHGTQLLPDGDVTNVSLDVVLEYLQQIAELEVL